MEDKQEVTHRSGFVNIVGNPNVGKSTLMNLLVGERVSIITSKAQTTRHRIMGIVNTPRAADRLQRYPWGTAPELQAPGEHARVLRVGSR